MQLKEVNAVVTGGASGLGLAVATDRARRGQSGNFRSERSPRKCSAAAALGPRAVFFGVDVSDEAAVDDAVKQAATAMGSINAAINCAGIAPQVVWSDGRVRWRAVHFAA